MNRIINILLLTALLLTFGCNHDEFDVDDSVSMNRVRLNIHVVSNEPASKGTPQIGTTAYEKSKINILGYVATTSPNAELYDFIALVSKETTGWEYTPVKMWNGKTYNFYGYASDLASIVSAQNANGLSITSVTGSTIAPTITYNVPSNVALQPDLLIATPSKGKKPSGGNVEITMNHALSCIGFVATSQLAGRTVKSITLKGVKSGGSIRLDKDPALLESWDTSTWGKKDYVAGIETDQELEKDIPPTANTPAKDLTYIMQGNGYLMMVPQVVPEGARIEVVVWNGSPELGMEDILSFDIPAGSEWLPGKKYIYYFDEVEPKGVVSYYEVYSNGALGLYYYDGTTLINTIVPTENTPSPVIVDAGYGLLVPVHILTKFSGVPLSFAVGSNKKIPSTLHAGGAEVAKVDMLGGTATPAALCKMTQNNYPFGHTDGIFSGGGIQPPLDTNEPQKVTASLGDVLSSMSTYGYCLPHYARGIYYDRTVPTIHFIRTPIQLRNISYQTNRTFSTNLTVGSKYVQEYETMNFTGTSGSTIRGVDIGESSPFYESLVRTGSLNGFGGIYDGLKRFDATQANHLGERTRSATIAGLKMQANNSRVSTTGGGYFGIFEECFQEGIVSNLANDINCSLTIPASNRGGANTAGFYVGGSNGTLINLINRATVTHAASNSTARIGGIVGLNGMNGTAGNKSIVRNCNNEGSVNGTNNVGGIVGVTNYHGLVDGCANWGNIYRNTNYTPIDYTSQVGGIVGLQQAGDYYNNKFTPIITNCTNYGNVSYSGSQIHPSNLGGVVGCNDWNWKMNDFDIPATAWGEVNNCQNFGNITGYGGQSNGVGGIVGGNNGKIKMCQSTGTITANNTMNGGGIAGFNTYYISDCVYYNSSASATIIAATGAEKTTVLGGIVGFNSSCSYTIGSTTDIIKAGKYAPSAFIGRCLFLAVAPQRLSTSLRLLQNEIPGVAPIAGRIGEYLFRKANGSMNINVDGTTGATPFYTVENNYFLSGQGVNLIDNSAYNSLYGPIPDNGKSISYPSGSTIGPFTQGRFPIGMSPLASNYFSVLPFMNYWNTLGWKRGTVFPYIDNTKMSEAVLSNVPAQGTHYFAYKVVEMINNNRVVSSGSTTTPLIELTAATIINTLRIDLFHINPQLLFDSNGNPLTSITINCNNLTFGSAPGNTYGGLVIKAPEGWSGIKVNQGSGGSSVVSKYGDSARGYYVYITYGTFKGDVVLTQN